MDTPLTESELARGLSDVLNRVRYQGEHFTIERNGEPIGAIVPVRETSSITLKDLANYMDTVPSAGPDFADDLEAIHASQTREEPTTWPC
jgi:prevent-host-death family protein